MDIINVDDIKTLTAKQEGPCFSIFMPMTRKNTDQVQQNEIRFKNQIQEIENILKEKNFKSHEITKMLMPAVNILNDKGFWFHQAEGLAVYIAPGVTRTFRVPINYTEERLQSDSFQVAPLLPMLTGNGTYYVLGIDQGSIKLYKADRDSMNELELRNVPTSFDEYMETEEPVKGPQNRMQTTSMSQPRPTSSQNDRGAAFHGQGEATDGAFHKKKIVDFFHWAEDGVNDLLRGKNDPLVLVGLEFLVPLWKEVNNYNYVFPEHLYFNPLSVSVEELHKRTWNLIQPEFLKAKTSSLNLFGQFRSQNLASTSLKEIVQAAYSKRVDTLFIKKNSKVWGTFNTSSLKVNVDEQHSSGSMELLNYAAVQTLQGAGTVYVLEHEEMPEGAAAAAVFRF